MKNTVLMLQNNMNPPGGRNTVSLWMLEAIKNEYDVTVLTWDPVDFALINDFYGTDFKTTDFKVIVISGWTRALMRWVPDPWEWQRFCILMRRCKKIQRDYDLLLSAHDETDFGRAGIQYVHYPFQAGNWALEKTCRRAGGWLERIWKQVSIRLVPWRIISGFSFDRMMKNQTLVNSNWTGQQYEQTYGPGLVKTVYPPVEGKFPSIPWAEKENGFVCVGRFAEDKRIDKIITLLSRVRDEYPDIRLHIVGTYSPWEDENAYYRLIRQAAEDQGDWVQVHENLSRKDLIELVSRQRYGIHGKLEEHFGLGIAEMLMAGCIPFVPNGGGQVEIVGNLKHLVYNGDDEAVLNIGLVLKDGALQDRLRMSLEKQKEKFTLLAFNRNVQQALESYFSEAIDQGEGQSAE